MTEPTRGHMLRVLPKAAEDANTVSGKCECGEQLGAAKTQGEIELRWRTHMSELGLLDVDNGRDTSPAETESVDTGSTAVNEAVTQVSGEAE